LKYRATATVVWEFESDLDYQESIEEARSLFLQNLIDIKFQRVGIKLEKYKKPNNLILGEFPASEIFQHVTDSEKRKEFKIDNKSYFVRMNSHRYFVFLANQCCVSCGIRGTIMRLEQHPSDKSPHFNLYAIEGGKYVLMTKDHIRAKSNGGEDSLSNYQTMCCVCNNLKGSDFLTLKEIRHLRAIYNENRDKLTRKKLNARMRLERNKIANAT
jgi:5-methylcytosine-specific restriction endonuclease McrA